MNQKVSEPICLSERMEFVFDLLLHAGEDVAVDVVDEVEGGEEDEGGGGSGYRDGVGFGGGRHWGKDSKEA